MTAFGAGWLRAALTFFFPIVSFQPVTETVVSEPGGVSGTRSYGNKQPLMCYFFSFLVCLLTPLWTSSNSLGLLSSFTLSPAQSSRFATSRFCHSLPGTRFSLFPSGYRGSRSFFSPSASFTFPPFSYILSFHLYKSCKKPFSL